jgi:putative Mn2+ efflux pump MntP
MDVLTIIGIALGLSMDAFAVSVASGVSLRCFHIKHALRIAIFFGAFQAAMPVIGWLAGLTLRNLISQFDHWIAFGLLTVIGIKMIVESLGMEEEKEKCDTIDIGTLLLLAIATSIDALAVGVTFAFLGIAILTPILIIGIVTFGLSLTGVYIGDRLGHFFEKKIEIVGGIILIGIGIKIVAEHYIG